MSALVSVPSAAVGEAPLLPPALTALKLTLVDGVAEVELHRPEKSNAMNRAMWGELRATFRISMPCPRLASSCCRAPARISLPASISKC